MNILKESGLRNKVAIVTGGSRGIGRAIALKLASFGSKIVINSTNKSRSHANKSVKEIRDLGSDAIWVPGDISKKETSEIIIKKAIDKFSRVDILVNNAGIADSHPFLSMDQNHWSKVIKTNLDGSFFMTKAVVSKMLQQESGGSIIFISSMAVRGNPWQANYGASKGGIESLMKSVAVEFGSFGIRSNAISPGLVNTDATKKMRPGRKHAILSESPLGRIITVDEIASLAWFLASDLSAAINGQVIHIDGGIIR